MWKTYYNDINTGDIFLFHGENSILSWLIEYFTGSKWSHVGIVLKDPIYISPHLKGLYLWNCGYEDLNESETNSKVLGVQLIPLIEMIEIYSGKIAYRKLNYNSINIDKIIEIHKQIHFHGYDCNIFNLINTLHHKSINIEPETFVCSTFLAYVLQELNILKKDILWSNYLPKDFSSENKNFKLNPEFILSKEIFIK